MCQRGALPHSPGGWQQAGPAEGGSPLSHDLSGSCAHLGAIHFLPENSLPLQLQEEGVWGGVGGAMVWGESRERRGVWLQNESRAWYSKPWA